MRALSDLQVSAFSEPKFTGCALWACPEKALILYTFCRFTQKYLQDKNEFLLWRSCIFRFRAVK